jgi:hypothetical protein
MQKLEERNTYTPTDIPHVRSNCGLALNREETLSVPGLKTSSNTSDAVLTAEIQGHAGQNTSVSVVYVLNMRGKPLMPTAPKKARILLKEGKAKVVKRTPFTIQLKYATGETKQEIILGVDSGYENIGLSAVTITKEVYSADVKLRTDIVKLNSERKQYRGARRYRKTWYRQPRFLNRKIPDGWLAPSIQHKLDSHIKIIYKVKKILPVSCIVVEVASFDAQKLINPEISGIEYQQGELQGYEIREYLLEKFERKCAYCGKTAVPMEIEHIVPKSRGGSDRVSNLTISCRRCNQEKGNRTAEEFGHPEVQEQAKEPLKSTAFMNNIRWKLVNMLNCRYTYGHITKHNRIKLGLEKSHINDAFVIAGGKTQERVFAGYSIQQVRKCNRKLFKGDRSHIKNTAERIIKGYQRFDKVLWNGIECFIFGRRTSGYFDLRKLDGIKIHASAKAKELTLLESANTFLTELKKNMMIGYHQNQQTFQGANSSLPLIDGNPSAP